MRHLEYIGLACLLSMPAWATPPPSPKTGAAVKQDAEMTHIERRDWRKTLNAARNAQKAGKLTDAVALFDTALAMYPDDTRALGERGWARYQQKKMKAAEADIRAALARTGDPRIRGSQLYNLGRVQEATQRIGAAIESYRASLAARPHPVVKKRLEALTKHPLTLLEIKPAKIVDKTAPLCPKGDDSNPFGEIVCTKGTVGKLGDAALETLTVMRGMGEETTHLIFKVKDGRRFMVEAHSLYNPGAFGIFSETQFLRFSVEGSTLIMHGSKHRRDSDMGLNEIELEEMETRMYCGVIEGVPHCTKVLNTLYDGRREIFAEEDEVEGAEHDLWSKKWALSIKLEGKTLRIGNAGAKLPPGRAELVGSHKLAW